MDDDGHDETRVVKAILAFIFFLLSYLEETRNGCIVTEMNKMTDDRGKLANVNLKVTEDEKWAFKALCAKHRMSQVDGFRLAATLLEEHLEKTGGASE